MRHSICSVALASLAVNGRMEVSTELQTTSYITWTRYLKRALPCHLDTCPAVSDTTDSPIGAVGYGKGWLALTASPYSRVLFGAKGGEAE